MLFSENAGPGEDIGFESSENLDVGVCSDSVGSCVCLSLGKFSWWTARKMAGLTLIYSIINRFDVTAVAKATIMNV